MKVWLGYLRRESGATFVEYTLMAALLALIIFGVFMAFGNKAGNTFYQVGNKYEESVRTFNTDVCANVQTGASWKKEGMCK